MFWYVILCILMLYPLSIVYAGNISGKRTQCVALMAACLILWFFMAMRSTEVGVDTKYYSHVFTQFSEIPFSKVFTAELYATEEADWIFNFEYGYRLYNKLISLFSNSPQAITVCNSSIIIVLLYYFIKKNSPIFLLSIWLYITLGIFQTEMNVTRNAIAILIVFHAFRYVKQKRIFSYVFSCIFAAFFHKAVLVFIPVYWIIHKVEWNWKRMIGCMLFTVLVGGGCSFISPYLSTSLPYGLGRYFTSTNSKAEAIIVGAFYLTLFLIICFFMNAKERIMIYSECKIGTTMFTLNLCCFGLSAGVGYASRIAALFGPYMIIFIPELISRIEDSDKKKMVTCLAVAVCGCQYFMRLLINNIGGTLPYTFFW